jgi:hypothetical protein
MKARVSGGISVRKVFETRWVGVRVYLKGFLRLGTMIMRSGGEKYEISVYFYDVVEGWEGCQAVFLTRNELLRTLPARNCNRLSSSSEFV